MHVTIVNQYLSLSALHRESYSVLYAPSFETKSVNNTLPWDAIFAGVIIDRCDRDRRCGFLHLFKENSERDCFDE